MPEPERLKSLKPAPLLNATTEHAASHPSDPQEREFSCGLTVLVREIGQAVYVIDRPKRLFACDGRHH